MWGIASAYACLTFQMIFVTQAWPVTSLWGPVAADVIAIVFSIWRARYYQRTRGRQSFLHREFLNVLWLSFSMAFLVDLLGANIFPGMAQSAIWTVAEIFVLLYIGVHGNIRAIVAALAIIIGLAVANYEPHYVGFWLAGGMFVGYTGFGVAELFARN